MTHKIGDEVHGEIIVGLEVTRTKSGERVTGYYTSRPGHWKITLRKQKNLAGE